MDKSTISPPGSDDGPDERGRRMALIRLGWSLLAASLTLGTSSCGGGSGGDGNTAPTPTPSPPPPSPSPPPPSPPPSPSPPPPSPSPAPPPATAVFPLSIHASGRYFVDAQGSPFFLNLDAGWSAVVNLTATQIRAYVDDCYAKGFTGILVNAIEHQFSNQSPAYRNAAGQDPFTSMTPVSWASPNTAYWTVLDGLVDYCKTKSMVVLINPAYLGYQGGGEGWTTELNAANATDLQTYGTWLANRYPQGNVLWSFGGDYDGTSTLRTQQARIQTGIRSVRTTDLVTFHTSPDKNSTDVVGAASYPNLFNWVYAYESDNAYPYAKVASAYSVSPTLPVYLGESAYEGEHGSTAQSLRRQSYSSFLAGALGGVCFGNSPIWYFGSGYASSFNSTGRVQQSYFAALVRSFQWWKLVPKTDNSLVTSSKGSGASPVCPALASDGSFALVYVPGSQTITVNTTALSGVSGNVRVRLYNVTTGTYALVGSFAKTNAQSVSTSGDAVVVIDAG